jgi:DNA-directed RNA polymerase subunit RPC12/RpoP
MTAKLLEVVVCDLCRVDRPAVAHVEIDVCSVHDQKLAERKSEALYECEQCGRPFQDPLKLRRHIARSHNADAENVCPYCGKELMNASGVNRHIGQKHPEEAA